MLLLAACGSDSDTPMELAGTTEVDELVLAAAADGNRLVTLSLSDNETQVALNIFEAADDGTLQELGSLTAPGDGYNLTSFNPSSLTVDDGVAYAALPRSNQSAIWAVDISDPEEPVEESLLETPNTMPVSIATSESDDLAAVGTGLIGTGITLVDISNPNAIERLGAFEHSAVSTAKVELADNYVYLVDMSGVTLIDVTDPDALEEVSFFENPTWTGLSSGEGGSTTISSTDRPHRPDLAVAEDYVLMTTGADTMEILSIDDPANVESVAQVETEFASISVTVSDDFAYVYSRGEIEFGEPMTDVPFILQKIDISDAEEPEVVQELEVSSSFPSAWQSIVAGDEHLFVLNAQSIDTVSITD